MSLFSISFARDSLTSRILPSRSAAAGSRIWLSIVARRSASFEKGYVSCHGIFDICGVRMYLLIVCCVMSVSIMQILSREIVLTFSALLVPHSHHREQPLGHLPVVATERDELFGSILNVR